MSENTVPPNGTMKAVVQDRYGPLDVLQLREVARPVVGDDGVLVKVRAASVNATDWHIMRGEPYFGRLAFFGLRRPKTVIRGIDVAGIVEAVGRNVTQFKPGDEVFGAAPGSFADYAASSEGALAPKPRQLTFEQAAAVRTSGITALQGLRDRGHLRAGQKVFIDGASGGVGTFAVQIAKALGADVTAVCGTRSVDIVRSLGADRVVDRTREDFTQIGQRYDVILDVAGVRSLSDCRRVLARDGTLVIIGGSGSRWLGPLPRLLQGLLLSRFVSQRLVGMVAKNSKDDLLILKELIEAGKLTPLIDRTYPLKDVAQAIRYVEERHAQGKVVITL